MVFSEINGIDTQIFLAINSIHFSAADFLSSAITHIGSIYFLSALGIIGLFLKNRRAKEFSAIFLPAYFTVLIIVEISKILVNRPRPFESLENVLVLAPKNDPSFPSGHSAGIFALASIGSKKFPNYKIFLYSLAAIVSFSRIYVGVHYPTDVLAGALIGFFVGKFFIKKFPPEIILKKLKKIS